MVRNGAVWRLTAIAGPLQPLCQSHRISPRRFPHAFGCAIAYGMTQRQELRGFLCPTKTGLSFGWLAFWPLPPNELGMLSCICSTARYRRDLELLVAVPQLRDARLRVPEGLNTLEQYVRREQDAAEGEGERGRCGRRRGGTLRVSGGWGGHTGRLARHSLRAPGTATTRW
jgi:hypothetical protein